MLLLSLYRPSSYAGQIIYAGCSRHIGRQQDVLYLVRVSLAIYVSTVRGHNLGVVKQPLVVSPGGPCNSNRPHKTAIQPRHDSVFRSITLCCFMCVSSFAVASSAHQPPSITRHTILLPPPLLLNTNDRDRRTVGQSQTPSPQGRPRLSR